MNQPYVNKDNDNIHLHSINSKLNKSYPELAKNLISLQDNELCFDCNKDSINWVNTLFGIFICSNCAYNHKKCFNKLTNHIKNFDHDEWNKFDIEALIIGGNSIFKSYLREYNISINETDIKKKYITKCGIYYFTCLISRIYGHWKNINLNAPSINEGKELVEDTKEFNRVLEKFENNKLIIKNNKYNIHKESNLLSDIGKQYALRAHDLYISHEDCEKQ